MINLQSFRAGARIGKYRIISEIGRGGMGVVFLAEDTSLSRNIALKILPVHLLADSSFQDRFSAEAKIVGSLVHPSIVHVNSFEVLEGIPVIDMEYVEAGSLSDKLRAEAIPIGDLVRYSHNIASALQYCHSCDAIHRDIKPSNILIDNFNRARLSDFGIAKMMSGNTEVSIATTLSGGIQGTLHYLPPEAWDGESPIALWDIYALGVVLYEALTGATPYPASTPLEMAKQMATCTLRPMKSLNPGTSDSLASLVDQMLAPDPSTRIQNADEVVAQLEQVPEFAEPVTSTTQTRQLPRSSNRTHSRKEHQDENSLSKSNKSIVRLFVIPFVIFLTIFALYALYYGASSPVVNSADSQSHISYQVPEAITQNTNVTQLLDLWKPHAASRTAVLTAGYQSVDMAGSTSWLVDLSATESPERIIVVGDGHVATMRAKPTDRPGTFELAGEWGGYADWHGTALRYGTLVGELHWTSQPFGAVGSVTYVASQDHARYESTFVASPHQSILTNSQFIYQAEKVDFLQPILINELIPRNMAWATEIVNLFPAFVDGSANVPLLDASSVSFEHDGSLTESIWSHGPKESGSVRGVIVGRPVELEPTLRLIRTEESLLIAVESAVLEGEADLVFEFSLMQDFSIPNAESAYHHVLHNVSRQSTWTRLYRNGEETPLDSCSILSSVTDGAWRAEGIFALSLPDGSMTNTETSIWRMNAVLYSTRDTRRRVIARWGFPDEKAVHHGTVLLMNNNAKARVAS